MFQFLKLKIHIDSLIAAVAGLIIICLFARHGGIGVCPDGVAYLTTAENFYTNGKLIDFTHNALVDFPLLYPLFLSLLSLLTGLHTLLFAPVLNAILFASLIYISGYMMEQFPHRSRWYKRSVLSCIVLSPCLLEVYSMVWSETIFLLLLMWFIVAIHKYFKSYSRKSLVTVAIITALASVTRYAGITIIGTGALLLLLDMKLPIKRKFAHILVYAAISPLLLIINLSRNFIVSGTLTGMRERSIRTLIENSSEAGSVLYNWITFSNNNYAGKIYICLIFFSIILLVSICVHQFAKHRRFTSYQNIGAVFSLVFIVFMLASASISRFEEMDSRLLSPLFIPLLWSCSSWLVNGWETINHFKKKWIIALGVMMLCAFQYNQLNADYETWDGVKDAGIPGYTEDQWKYSETVLFIQKNSILFQKNFTIYSNAYDAINFFTGRSGKFLPHKEFKHDVQQFLNDSHCYMVWFIDGENPDLVDIPFITKVKKMRLIRQFTDGAIYEYNN